MGVVLEVLETLFMLVGGLLLAALGIDSQWEVSGRIR